MFALGVTLALIASVAWLTVHATRLAEGRADAHVATPAPPAPTVNNSAPATPTTYADLPLGPETTLPFVDRAGRLHLGNTPRRVFGSRMSTAGWTVLMYERAELPGPVWIARGATTVQVPGLWAQPVLSKDGGRLFALQQTGDDMSALVAVDTTSGEEIDRIRLDGLPATTDLLGTDRTRAYFRAGRPASGPAKAWEPGRAVQHISLPLDYQDLIPLRRGVLLHNPGEMEARFATIEADGTLAQPGVHAPLPGTVADSPDGSVVAIAGDAGGSGKSGYGVAVDMSTSETVDLRIPDAVDDVHVAGFESDRSVVLHTATPTESWYLRCWVDTGTCDRITNSSRTPTGHQIHLP